MKNTPAFRALIARRLRDASMPKLNQSEIADKMGFGKAWMSKLMTGKLQSIDEDQIERLESILGIKLQKFRDAKAASPFAQELDSAINANPVLAKAIEALIELAEQTVIDGPRYIQPSEMSGLGQTIIRIAFADQDKPGKVAREVLKLLA